MRIVIWRNFFEKENFISPNDGQLIFLRSILVIRLILLLFYKWWLLWLLFWSYNWYIGNHSAEIRDKHCLKNLTCFVEWNFLNSRFLSYPIRMQQKQQHGLKVKLRIIPMMIIVDKSVWIFFRENKKTIVFFYIW